MNFSSVLASLLISLPLARCRTMNSGSGFTKSSKDNLSDFLRRESWPGFEIEVLAEHDMFRRIDHFFNRAMYYAARGFEQAERARQALELAAN